MNFDLAELTRRVGRYRRPTLVPAEILPTLEQERDLRRIYMAVVRGWVTRVRETVLPAYKRAVAGLITDDESDNESLVFTTALSARQMEQLAVALERALGDWVSKIEAWHRKRFAQSFVPTGVQLETLLGPGDVRTTLRAALAENVSLIKSLDDQMRNGVAGAVYRGLQNRSTARDVAREIRKLTGVATSRAELIASDQLQKLTSLLDQERQRQAGIRKFKWAHSHKKFPRPEHVARDGHVYAWSSAVGRNDPPGRAIRCGCKARAVLVISDEN